MNDKQNNNIITDKEILDFQNIFNNKNEDKILMKLLDECLKQERYDDYNDWIIIGMALKNTFGNNGFKIFDYVSKKSNKYDGIIKTKQVFDNFLYMSLDGYTIATIYNHLSVTLFSI